MGLNVRWKNVIERKDFDAAYYPENMTTSLIALITNFEQRFDTSWPFKKTDHPFYNIYGEKIDLISECIKRNSSLEQHWDQAVKASLPLFLSAFLQTVR